MALDSETKARWLREFRLNGFVVLPGFLETDFVRKMHDELTPLLDAEREKAEQDGWAKGRGPGRLALRLEQYAKLFRGALADDRYQRNPVVEELVDAILGADGWARGWTQVEAVWKGSVHMGWHSDQSPDDTPDIEEQPAPRRVTFNIPLVDFTHANGTTEYIPGTHRLPLAFHYAGNYTDLPRIYPVLLTLRVGDAVLRDGNIIHRGTPNLTDEVRPMLDQTYKKS